MKYIHIVLQWNICFLWKEYTVILHVFIIRYIEYKNADVWTLGNWKWIWPSSNSHWDGVTALYPLQAGQVSLGCLLILKLLPAWFRQTGFASVHQQGHTFLSLKISCCFTSCPFPATTSVSLFLSFISHLLLKTLNSVFLLLHRTETTLSKTIHCQVTGTPATDSHSVCPLDDLKHCILGSPHGQAPLCLLSTQGSLLPHGKRKDSLHTHGLLPPTH